MHQGKFVFSQVVSIISQYEFNKSVEKYKGNYRAKDLRCWQHFLYMMFGQLTYREGIRDIISCLDAHKSKVYHLGLKKIVAHTGVSSGYDLEVVTSKKNDIEFRIITKERSISQFIR